MLFKICLYHHPVENSEVIFVKSQGSGPCQFVTLPPRVTNNLKLPDTRKSFLQQQDHSTFIKIFPDCGNCHSQFSTQVLVKLR
jgi:hypothetical protein